MAGNFWYEAPSWKIHQFRTLGGGIDSAGNGFLNSDYDVPLDVDRDGWMDVVTGFIYDGLAWYRNPGIGTAQWVRTQIDGDGKRLELRPIRGQEFGKNIAWPWDLSRASAWIFRNQPHTMYYIGFLRYYIGFFRWNFG